MFLQPVVPAAAPGASKTQPSHCASHTNAVGARRRGCTCEASISHPKGQEEPLKWFREGKGIVLHQEWVELKQSLPPSAPANKVRSVVFCP